MIILCKQSCQADFCSGPGACKQLNKLVFRAVLVSSACKSKICHCSNTLKPQKTHNQSALHYHLVVVAWSGVTHISRSYGGEFSYHHQEGTGTVAAEGCWFGLTGIGTRKH